MKKLNLLTLMLTAVLSVASLVYATPALAATYKIYQCTNNDLGFPSCTRLESSSLPSPTAENNPVLAWLQFILNLFSMLIISGSVVMIAVAGVQYSAARDNSQATQKAKERITNVLFGLLAFMFFYAFMQWLIPGGVF